jgi:TonB-dependent SusC/RagA subfamily outer membrane receptor
MIRQLTAGAVLFTVACSGNSAPHSPMQDEVSVGYGTQERTQITGAVSTVTKEEIDRARVTRIEDLIRSRIPGVQVLRKGNGELAIRVRGPSTLNGRDDALIVLDGLPLAEATAGMALATLNPQEVQRIDVLKDAGSTAIYGSRGTNGVVIIKTRRGNRQ